MAQWIDLRHLFITYHRMPQLQQQHNLYDMQYGQQLHV
jgi:hypothetical protein